MTAHAVYGGSNASRWMGCPASTALIKTVPPQPVGQAAIDGTALHAAMEMLLLDVDKEPDDFLGATIMTVTFTKEHVEQLKIALDAYDEFLQLIPEGELKAEDRVTLTDEAWGTTDLLSHGPGWMAILDWKFGYEIVDAKDNAQGLFYAAAARKTHKLKPKTITVAICQPAADPALDVHTYTAEELDAFEVSALTALRVGQSGDAPFIEGSWCKYCPAKIACPLKTQALATLTKPGALDLKRLGEQLLIYKDLSAWADDATARIQHELEHGVAVPGFKLVNKVPRRQWKDEVAAAKALKKLGAKARELISPAKAEKLGIKVGDLAVSVSSGTTIAPASDKRPAVLPIAAIGAQLKRLL